MAALDNLLAAEVAVHEVGTRNRTAALLAWFLQNVWRVEPEDIDSAICDGGGDKGVDALLVDDDLNEITIFQGKWRQNPTKTTQGGNDLKALVGAAEWFQSPDTVEQLLASRPNRELTNLLTRQQIVEKMASGSYTVRLVFVTNAALDSSGKDYMHARHGAKVTLEVWDRKKVTEAAERTKRPDLRSETVKLSAVSRPSLYKLNESQQMAIGLVKASELVKLPGIPDRTLFSRNVRLYAGKTRINKELADTVQTTNEHRLFPAYHNGLTLLTQRLEVRGKQMTLSHVGVVNGCQSLITLNEHVDALTDDLTLLVKIIEVSGSSEEADQITYRSNNQNTVTLRDQRSSDNAMRDLQVGVRREFGAKFAFEIRVGEQIAAVDRLENTLAAQLIMAAYLKEPWSAVRKVRLFDQDYRRIFNRNITPYKLRLLFLVNRVVSEMRRDLRDDLRASFASIRFTIVHLIFEVLRQTRAGRELIDAPERWLADEESKTADALEIIAKEVVTTVNFHVDDELENDDSYDPKIAFKSRAGVKRLEHDVVRDAKRAAKRQSSYLFSVTPGAKTAKRKGS